MILCFGLIFLSLTLLWEIILNFISGQTSVLKNRWLATKYQPNEADWLTMLNLLSGGLRAGLTFTQAFELSLEHAPRRLEQRFSKQVPAENSFSIGEKIGRVFTGSPVEFLIPLFRSAHDHGGALEPLLDRGIRVLRHRMAIQRKMEAMTAQVRLSARIIGAAPMLLIVGMASIDSSLILPFFSSVTGGLLLGVCFSLIVIGFYVMNKMAVLDA